MKAPLVLAVVALLASSGCLADSDPSAKSEPKRVGGVSAADAIAEAKATPHAVVALIDTGINAYHKTFRDTSPEAYLHPSTYIPDYPPEAEALNITLDADNYWLAIKGDCEKVWKNVKPGKLYWFPGTK